MCVLIILFLVAAVRRRRHKLRPSPIPEHLLVNERCNLLSNDTTGCANAVQAQYARERLRSPLLRGLKAIAWDDGMCFDGISRVHSAALARAIRHEGNGMYKSDACRLAQLAEHGGYYLDNDVVPHIDVRELGAARVGCASHPSFIAVRQSWEPVQFLNAFVAATPRHPIIMRALNLTARFYNVDTPPERGGLDGGLRGARRGGSYLGDRDAAGPLKRRLHGRRLFWMGPLTLRVAYGASRVPPPHTHTHQHTYSTPLVLQSGGSDVRWETCLTRTQGLPLATRCSFGSTGRDRECWTAPKARSRRCCATRRVQGRGGDPQPSSNVLKESVARVQSCRRGARVADRCSSSTRASRLICSHST